MKLSIIIATRNRAYAIGACLDSMAAAFARAALLDAEIVVVDNGSTDNTAEVIRTWASASSIPVQCLFEPAAGKGRALNLALRAARGELIAFTDDDCRLHVEHTNDLLRHAAADTDLRFRGGRIELGDPTDLPFTIDTHPTTRRWSLAMNSARDTNMGGCLAGCNMTAPRALIDRVGPFDEDFGPGSKVGAGEDADYIYRAYLSGAIIEYVPDMAVSHYHGRKTSDAGRALYRRYMTGSGALAVKYLLKHPNLCRPFYWDMKNAVREIITGTNTCLPSIGFSHRDKLAYSTRGAIRYLFMRKDRSTRKIDALEAEGFREDDVHHFVKGADLPPDFV